MVAPSSLDRINIFIDHNYNNGKSREDIQYCLVTASGNNYYSLDCSLHNSLI